MEIILLPIIIPLTILSFGIKDIFLLEKAFPWLILIPTLAASRYGTWYGLLSLSIFSLFCLVYVSIFQPSLFTSAIQILSGGLVLVVFIGEMTQRWKQRNKLQIKQLKECRLNSNQSEKALQLLHISYSYLEEELITTTQSLSNSLRLIDISINQKSQNKKDRLQLAANKMKQILQQYEWLESAAFYYVNNKGKINSKALCHIGVITPNLHLSPLLSKVIDSKKSISINHNLSYKETINNPQQLQAGIPLLDENNHLWGVLAIARITPSIFMQQNLNLLSLLCAYVANLLSNVQRPLTNSEQLILDISASANIVFNKVKSLTLSSIEIQASSRENDYQNFFISKIRGANRCWQLQNNHKKELIIMLPLLKETHIPHWSIKLEATFKKQFGVSFEQANIKLSSTYFNKEKAHISLKKYLSNISEFDYARLIR